MNLNDGDPNRVNPTTLGSIAAGDGVAADGNSRPHNTHGPTFLEPELDEPAMPSSCAPVEPVVGEDDGGSRIPIPPPEVEFSDNINRHGFVPFFRSLIDEWWFQHQPWSYMQIFWWLVCKANYMERKTEFEGHIVTIPRGGVATSKLAMANRAGVSRDTIDRFLRKMQEGGALKVTKGGYSGILITITNYDRYTKVQQRPGSGPSNGPAAAPATHKAKKRQQNELLPDTETSIP